MKHLAEESLDVATLEKVMAMNPNQMPNHELFLDNVISTGNVKLALYLLKKAHKDNE